jgi:hypothetical protein
MLGTHGLGQLEDGTGLLAQLGFMVQDHEHLRSLLVRCEPENRSSMYDSLKPYLRFEARPLDSYIAESAQRAEAQKLPTIDAAGNLTWQDKALAPAVSATTVSPDDGLAQRIVNHALAKHHLVVTCRSCTRQEQFTGDTQADAVLNARLAGWVYYVDANSTEQEICPECPAVRRVS